MTTFVIQGEPAALFVSDSCDIPSHFGSHNIIINLTLCECYPLHKDLIAFLTPALAYRR